MGGAFKGESAAARSHIVRRVRTVLDEYQVNSDTSTDHQGSGCYIPIMLQGLKTPHEVLVVTAVI